MCLQISVIGIIGDGYKSDIAIDDIAFFPYPCFKETTTPSTTTVTETVTSTLTTFTTTATETASLATMGMTTKGTRNATSTSSETYASTKPMQDTTKLLTITTTTTDTEAATSSTPTGIISTETSTSTGLSASTNILPTNFSATTTWDENSPSTEVRITDDSTTAHISPTTEPDSSRLLFKTTDVVNRTSSLLDLSTKTSSKNIITTDSTASISLDNSTSFENYSNSVTESILTNESSISIWSKNQTVTQDTLSTTASVLSSSTTGSLIGTSDNDVEPTQVSLNHTAANSTAANSSATQTYDSQDLYSTSPHPSVNLLPTVTAAEAVDCNVTQPNICDYESSLEPCANQTGRWGVVSGIITPKGPTIDHTYGNNTGHYLLLGLQKVFDDWVTVWDPEDAIITCDVCMRYYYSANMGLGGLLRFWQVFNDTRGVDATLVSVIENKTEPNDWTMVEATMRLVDHFKFHLVFNNHVKLLDN